MQASVLLHLLAGVPAACGPVHCISLWFCCSLLVHSFYCLTTYLCSYFKFSTNWLVKKISVSIGAQKACLIEIKWWNSIFYHLCGSLQDCVPFLDVCNYPSFFNKPVNRAFILAVSIEKHFSPNGVIYHRQVCIKQLQN